MKKQQLFFDLDRTLWDFEANSQKALNILYHDLKLDNYTEHFIQFHTVYKKINGELWEQYAKNKLSKEELRISRFSKTLAHFKIVDAELAERLSDGYVAISPNQTLLFPNTIETLTELKNADYSMSIITNGFSEVQFRKLDNCGLSPFFDHVICSETIGYSKPDKRVYDYALEKTNAQATNAIMIGDDINADILGAEAAGITGILFDEDARKKYDSRMHRVKDLSELPLLLLKL